MKTKSILKIFILSGLLLPIFFCCQKEEIQEEIQQEKNAPALIVRVTPVTNTSSTSAVIGGEILSDGGSPVMSCGFCWSTNNNPAVTDNVTNAALSLNSFTCSITGLSANTLYFVRAFATTAKGTGYSELIFFRTSLETITDIEGNVYKIAKIGNQTWMTENLKTTKYRNGDPVPKVTAADAWRSLSDGAYCPFIDNDNILYNWYAASDTRGLAPEGWHIPSKADWTTLFKQAGGPLYEASYLTDKGFSMKLGGYRVGSTGAMSGFASEGYWWSSDEYPVTLKNIWGLIFMIENNKVSRNSGYSIRCIKD
jgi:uncharacterized protein (TIGR02145 family)